MPDDQSVCTVRRSIVMETWDRLRDTDPFVDLAPRIEWISTIGDHIGVSHCVLSLTFPSVGARRQMLCSGDVRLLSFEIYIRVCGDIVDAKDTIREICGKRF